MQVNRVAVAVVLVIALVVAGWWMFKRSSAGESIDLVETFDTAEKRPADGTFEVIEADLNGDTRRAIFTEAPSRIIWPIRVPDDGWLRVALGVKPEAWDQEGDGVQFRIGISDGRQYEPLVTQLVNPFANKGDRRWIPVMIDLSPFSGEDVTLIFNTDNSPEGKGHDPRGDLALWGAPEIVVR
ncbi:MAG: hypothetical protein H0X67_15530 [Acidobacteria bacterium]|nr:hypothetical protein [Acidobacteriota bacterium]